MPRIEGSETLELPRDEVWRLLNDPGALGASIPGCRGFDRDGQAEHRYRTAIKVAVGAVTGVYEGTVEYRDVEEPNRCTIVVSGRGENGTIQGEGAITLSAREQRTEVGYRGDFKLTGPIAGVGQRLAPGVSRKMIVETLRNLERRGAAPAEPAPEPSTAPPEVAGAAPPAAPPAEHAAEPFRPFSISPTTSFAAGCAVGIAIGILIGLLL
jgi:carbon monoxide dehydrogenase subunit G